MNINIEELKRLHEKATQGKWQIGEMDYEKMIEVRDDDDEGGTIVVHVQENSLDTVDAEFICYVHNNCEEIIQALEERDKG